MAPDPALFLFGTPLELSPQEAYRAGAAVVATSQSTYANQMDIASVIPGVFRGLLDVRATHFSVPAEIAAAEAIAALIPDDELHANYISPKIFDYQVAPAVAAAVAEATVAGGYAKRPEVTPETVAERTLTCVYEGKFPIPGKSEEELNISEESLELHERFQGLLEVCSNVPVKDEHILKQIYLVPGAMEPVRLIRDQIEQVNDITARGNLVGVVSDGSDISVIGHRVVHGGEAFHQPHLIDDEIVAALHRSLFGADSLPPQTSMLVKRAVAYMHQNYTRPLARWEISEAIGASENYFSRLFNQELGLSPWEYLNRFRVCQAKELFRRTQGSVKSIAGQVGFKDPKYFSRVFRKQTDLSPSEFREQSKPRISL